MIKYHVNVKLLFEVNIKIDNISNETKIKGSLECMPMIC